MKILILGIGNLLLTDEGVGGYVVWRTVLPPTVQQALPEVVKTIFRLFPNQQERLSQGPSFSVRGCDLRLYSPEWAIAPLE
jgi:Ni,Fe-hydrogenase maturation factor